MIRRLIIILLLILPILVFCEERQTSLAVLDFTAAKGVTEDEAGLLTDKFIVSLKKTKKYKIMSRTEIVKILKEQNFQMSGRVDQEEAVKIGKILGVNNVIVGRMGKVGNTFLVIIQLVDVQTSEILKAIDRSYKGNVDQLISIMTELAYEIAGIKTSWLSPTPKPISTGVVGKNYTETYGGLNLEMVWIPGGTFQMGSNDGESIEKPVHKVELDGFWIGKYEITQAQWIAIMGTSIAQQRDKLSSSRSLQGVGLNYPMYYISWYEAMEFCEELSKKTGRKYNLPSEAQWEYACRGGSTNKFCFGDYDSKLGDYAWYDSNSNNQAHPVGQKKPNAWGLYDMHGNIWEWCLDYYGENYYSKGPNKNPVNLNPSSCKMLRGGFYLLPPSFCSSFARIRSEPGARGGDTGFRVVRNSD